MDSTIWLILERSDSSWAIGSGENSTVEVPVEVVVEAMGVVLVAVQARACLFLRVAELHSELTRTIIM